MQLPLGEQIFQGQEQGGRFCDQFGILLIHTLSAVCCNLRSVCPTLFIDEYSKVDQEMKSR